MAEGHTGWSVDHSQSQTVIEVSSISEISPISVVKSHMPVVMSAAPVSSGATLDGGTVKHSSLFSPRSDGSSVDATEMALALAELEVERAKAKAAALAVERAQKRVRKRVAAVRQAQ